MQLIGFDIGFSEKKRTSGVARLRGRVLSCSRATSEWDNRAVALGDGIADMAAIDGPILKNIDCPKRLCKTVFSCGCFGRRCKPGFSHVPGTGRKLRAAGKETAEHMDNLTRGHNPACGFPRVLEGKNIVEAFPNAFLGVLLPDSRFKQMPKLRRREKFDWLYEQCRESHALRSVVDHLGQENLAMVLRDIETNRDHEERAALVCLLTAAGVAAGRYTAVGDDEGGYFFLPSFALWKEWARNEMETQRQRHLSATVWVDGERFCASDSLP